MVRTVSGSEPQKDFRSLGRTRSNICVLKMCKNVVRVDIKKLGVAENVTNYTQLTIFNAGRLWGLHHDKHASYVFDNFQFNLRS